MVSKVLSVLILAGCLLVADANPRVLLQMQQPTTGMQQPTTVMQQQAGSMLRVEAPATEEMLANFDLYLTPSQETMSDSQMLMQVLNNPDQFRTWVNERVQRPDGITVLAAVFSDLMSRGQAQQLAMALNQAFGQQQGGLSAQTGATSTQQPYNPPFTAFTLAIIDQIARRDIQRAGEAIYWALSGAGGQDLAWRTLAALDSMQAQIGCTDPLKTAFMTAGQFANMQMSSPTVGQGQQQQGTPAFFVTWVTQSPPLMACLQDAYPNFQMLMQQQGGMAGGATGAQPAGTQPAGTQPAGMTAGQP